MSGRASYAGSDPPGTPIDAARVNRVRSMLSAFYVDEDGDHGNLKLLIHTPSSHRTHVTHEEYLALAPTLYAYFPHTSFECVRHNAPRHYQYIFLATISS